jgi:hypothetical protein
MHIEIMRMSGEIVIRSVADVVDGVRRLVRGELLPGIAWSFEERVGTDPTVVLNVDGRLQTFAVKARVSATRRDVDGIEASKPTVLAVARLSDSLVGHCAQRGLSAIGLDGRIWLRTRGIVVDTRFPIMPLKFRTLEPEVKPFSSRSSRIGRALLSSGDRTWTVTQLAEATRISLSRVSQVLTVFKDEGWVGGSRGKWTLAEPDALLDGWAKADAWAGRVSLTEYTSLDRSPQDIAAKLPRGPGVQAAFTQWFAANLRYPYTTTPICSVYRSRPLQPEELAAAGLHEVATGGKLWEIIPRDEGVFQFTQDVNGLPLVCDAQIYLDLLQVGLRGPDHARALREWTGFRK